MYTVTNTLNKQTTTCKDAAHVRRLIKSLVKKAGVDYLMNIEVSNGKNVWLGYEF